MIRVRGFTVHGSGFTVASAGKLEGREAGRLNGKKDKG
jgi:hypothetical protein